jgi:hypothetical protein
MDLDLSALERPAEQVRARSWSEAPEFGLEVPAPDPAHRGDGAKESPARAENAVRVAHRGADVEDELERLSQDEAVERVRWDAVRDCEIGHYRGGRIRWIDIENVVAVYRCAEAFGVVGVQDLENTPVYSVPLLSEKTLDVVPVDRRATVTPPHVAEWSRAANCPEPGGTGQPPQPPAGALFLLARVRQPHARRA